MSENQEPQPESAPLHTEDNITSERLEKVSALVAGGAREAVQEELADTHASDIAQIISLLPYERRAELMRLIGDELPPDVFAELEGDVRAEVVESLDLDTLVSTVQELESDEAVFVLEDMDETARAEVLEQIPSGERRVLERSLEYPEGSAGRLMRSEFIAVSPTKSVGETIDYLRDADTLPDHFLEIFIIDEEKKPLGVVYPSEILRAGRDVNMHSLADESFTLVSADTDRKEAALMFERYNLVSVGVVDADGRLLGVITADDVFEVIADTAGEDILRLGGVSSDSFTNSVAATVRSRFSWLFLNLLTAIFASLVIALFDTSIDQMVALAILMPIVASMGGNAGTQTLTVTVRSLSLQELQIVDTRRAITREFFIGLANGLLFAVVVGLLGYLWFGSVSLGLVMGGAMIVTLVAAALAGILIPLALHKRGVDPAIASSVLVTTITDVVGFFVFLGFATIFLL